jgi:hypothetical protein
MRFGSPIPAMSTRVLLAVVAALLIVRLPSLVQPMGPDQGLYAYVGDRIRHGELAYRDAWDQKPPGIHYVYAVLRALSPRDVVVPAADLAAAAVVAALLWGIGTRLAGPLAGGLSAACFLLLSDPALGRYGGVRVRAQGETFIALAVAAAVLVAFGRRGPRRFGAGVLVGAAFALKYNAGVYVLVVLTALAVEGGFGVAALAWLAAGAMVIPALLLIVFWRGAALRDLFEATIVYNVHYSGQTYAGPLDAVRYLIAFPVEHARLDALWFAGGIGCVVLIALGFWARLGAPLRRRAAILPVVWVAVACLSIAINGSRNLPQYFVQAAPALALAAGVAAALAMPRLPRVVQWAVAILLAVGVWRAGDDPFPKLARTFAHDLSYMTGRIDRRTHLARYGGGRDEDKYSALANLDLGTFFAAHSSPGDRVFVFGFSPGAYVYADRASASRFFWSRPVILDFHNDDPTYGVAGLAADLARSRPIFVVLQMHDWAPDVQDSGPFFLSQPTLAGWLRAEYHQVPTIDGFQAWERNAR